MQFVHARFGYGPRLFEKSRIADSEFVAKTEIDHGVQTERETLALRNLTGRSS
jgi:hypothetical protein